MLILVNSLFSSDYQYEEERDTPEYENYQCDGREYCSQMTSCEEATYFINNCPNTKMDGDHDGVPCERQWCKGL
ncbi:excalibur calcium-binding domain-containing protein [Sulfurimonas sp. SWIR-19]|uniref:excalibur calcium-binding domain-containing protein n=1 Tax=Sulfurimonas sp. SWIR-19 TaxID=2878390 RepID=UPI001CF1AD41|nr:excalibur calcium-binding domain-containing protein [Sulfurimonas sp. SWIR-19]UCN00434.1 excalibur calcium-binding domain-containing protein [Sulfurimonas sp. SWIR-19]